MSTTSTTSTTDLYVGTFYVFSVYYILYVLNGTSYFVSGHILASGTHGTGGTVFLTDMQQEVFL